jgi:anti-sigma factor RsiW
MTGLEPATSRPPAAHYSQSELHRVESRAGESNRAGKFPAFIQDDPEAADEPVTDEALGALVRSALADSRDGVSHPDFRNDPEPARRRRRLFKLAGVRSETEFATGTRSVSISWDDTTPNLRTTPYRNEGRRRGFTQILDAATEVDVEVDNSGLGAAVRRLLQAATDGT